MSKAYLEYRDPAQPWFPPRPAHWTDTPMWTMFSRVVRKGFPEETLLSVYRDHGVVPKASRDDNFNRASEDLSSYQLVEPGDLVINKMKAWQGSLSISRHRGIVSPAYFVYRPHHREDDRFLHHLLRSQPMIGAYIGLSKGVRVAQWDLEPYNFSRLKMALPSLDEQRKIADFIEHEVALVDSLIAEQSGMAAVLRERRDAVILDAVTRGIDDRAHFKETGIAWLGRVPQHWDVLPLRRIGTSQSGSGFPPALQGQKGLELPFFKVRNLGLADARGVMSDAEDTISHDIAAQLRATVFPAGTLAYAKVGAALMLGRIRSLGVPGCLDNNMAGFIPFSDFDARFLSYAMTLVRFDYLVNPGAVPSVSDKNVMSYKVAIPPRSEQRSIAAYLDEQTQKIDALIAEAEGIVDVAKERRSALITAAVTGQIDVRGEVA